MYQNLSVYPSICPFANHIRLDSLILVSALLCCPLRKYYSLVTINYHELDEHVIERSVTSRVLCLMNEDGHRRMRLIDRLDALVTPRSSTDSLDSPTSMRRPPPPSSSAPVLRWLSNLTPDQSTTSLSIEEAINTPLPSRPPKAKLPPSFRPSHQITHPPPFFDNLTRSTMPTASLSPPPTVSSHSVPLHADLARPPPIVLTHSQPTRSSIDSLRSVHTRSMSTFSVSTPTIDLQSPTVSSSTWSWFFPQSKSETLLAQEDRPQNDQQKEEIKKKCMCSGTAARYPHLTP